jgi:hypothetical protein
MAVKTGVKKKEGENLTDANIEKVIGLLEAEKPITKKEACEILNIAYNTVRLGKIITEYQDKQESDKKRRAANRGKPASDYEISAVVESYLRGESQKEIADGLFRPVDFVKRVVEQVGVPSVQPGENYTSFSSLPEQCVAEEFTIGEFVWSSKDGAIAEIIRDCGVSQDGTDARIYQIYVYERIDWDKVEGRYSYMPLNATFGGFYGTQRAYDLGSLKHLKQYVPDMKRIIK